MGKESEPNNLEKWGGRLALVGLVLVILGMLAGA